MMPAEQLSRGTDLAALLSGLIEDLPETGVVVSGLCTDSRQIQAGDLFLAVAGIRAHGLDYLSDVISAGAAAVLWEPREDGVAPDIENGMPILRVEALSELAGVIADRFYDRPSADIAVVGVTGTDGKTQCAHFMAQVLSQDGLPAGVMGTLGNGVYGNLEPSAHTTPDALAVQRCLAYLRDRRSPMVAMEVSSHALDQYRVSGVRFDTAVLTNLGRDHLDYHGTLADYQKSKRRLFRTPGLRHAVLNIDDPFGREIHAELPADIHQVLYGSGDAPAVLAERATGQCDWISLQSVEAAWPGLKVAIDTAWGSGHFDVGVLGEFNAWNLMAALAVLRNRGVPFDTCLQRLALVRPVPGRMEWVKCGPGKPRVIVDYAHTPQALEAVLTTLRKYTSGKLVCVFGAGGERDLGKRPLMGGVVERLADQAIITDDNPRSESPETIVADIISGWQRPEDAWIEHDRTRAIERAIDCAGPGDIVLVAGKGHETGQTVAETTLPHDDRAVVSRFLDRGEA